jgi:hypothetical protein
MELKGCPKTRSQVVGKKYKYEGKWKFSLIIFIISRFIDTF